MEDGSLETLAANVGHGRVVGVLAVGDRPAVLAARAAAHYGVPWHSPDAAARSRNKVLTRQRFAAAGLPVPWFRVLPAGDTDPLRLSPPFPCVVKPLFPSEGTLREIAGR